MELSILIVLYDIGLIIGLLFGAFATLALMASPYRALAAITFVATVLCLAVLVMLHALWRGKRWGQIGATILVALQLLLDLAQISMGPQKPKGWVITLLIRIIFLIVLWMPATRAYIEWSENRGGMR